MADETAFCSASPVEHPTVSVANPNATTGHDVPAAALPASDTTGRYVLGMEIARGGMGSCDGGRGKGLRQP